MKDSINLLPWLLGQPGGPRHKWLLHQGGKAPWYALRERNWKLIMESNRKGKEQDSPDVTPVELYSLKTNPSEDAERNLIDSPEHEARVKAMLATYLRVRSTGEPTVTGPGDRLT